MFEDVGPSEAEKRRETRYRQLEVLERECRRTFDNLKPIAWDNTGRRVAVDLAALQPIMTALDMLKEGKRD